MLGEVVKENSDAKRGFCERRLRMGTNVNGNRTDKDGGGSFVLSLKGGGCFVFFRSNNAIV